jgi:hypothetical protein
MADNYFKIYDEKVNSKFILSSKKHFLKYFIQIVYFLFKKLILE